MANIAQHAADLRPTRRRLPRRLACSCPPNSGPAQNPRQVAQHLLQGDANCSWSLPLLRATLLPPLLCLLRLACLLRLLSLPRLLCWRSTWMHTQHQAPRSAC